MLVLLRHKFKSGHKYFILFQVSTFSIILFCFELTLINTIYKMPIMLKIERKRDEKGSNKNREIENIRDRGNERNTKEVLEKKGVKKN